MARMQEPEDPSDHVSWEAPEENGYEFQSEHVIGMLKQLFQQLQAARNRTSIEELEMKLKEELLRLERDHEGKLDDSRQQLYKVHNELSGTLDVRLVEHVEQLTRTVDDKHKTAFDELSDEIAGSTQQHEEKSLEDQETKLSNDRKTTELERIQESLDEQEAFLANLNPTQFAVDLLDCVTDFERVIGICVRMLEDFMSDFEKEHLYKKFKSTKESEPTTTQETLA